MEYLLDEPSHQKFVHILLDASMLLLIESA
jgi:hypothetical protein